ncbi:MAG: GNAT family N-acetyltransferase [Candidatus Aminicenantales bacterium]
MEIIDLTDEYLNQYFLCLEDWSDEIKEAGDHKERWYHRMKDKGLGVKLARDGGKVCGMIQYVPIEISFAEGKDLYFVHCIWVHGYKKKGVGNQQKKGMGKALLRAAEEDVRARGAKGMVAWGVALPFYMRASWFKKQGYSRVDKNRVAILLWKPFTDEAVPPKWIREKKKPGRTEGKAAVTAFVNGWCPAMNMVFERARRAASEFGDRVEFQAIDTFDRGTFLEWGIADGLFINGKQVRTGPPPSYKKIRKRIAGRVKQLKTK